MPNETQGTAREFESNRNVLMYSEISQGLIVKNVPDNTVKGALYAVRALAPFIINSEFKEKYFGTDTALWLYHMKIPKNRAGFEVNLLRQVLFGDSVPECIVLDETLLKINHFIEFSVKYRSSATENRAPRIL